MSLRVPLILTIEELRTVHDVLGTVYLSLKENPVTGLHEVPGSSGAVFCCTGRSRDEIHSVLEKVNKLIW